MTYERKCVICSSVYEFCPTCASYDKEPRWKLLFHDENCKKIYEVANAYGSEQMSAEEAKAKLEKLDLSNKKNFATGVRDTIDRIFRNANNGGAKQVKNNNKYNKHE